MGSPACLNRIHLDLNKGMNLQRQEVVRGQSDHQQYIVELRHLSDTQTADNCEWTHAIEREVVTSKQQGDRLHVVLCILDVNMTTLQTSSIQMK